MKTKILLFPLLLIIILTTIIWLIVPTWQRIGIQKIELQAKEKHLAEIQGKNQIIDRLLADFNNDISAQETVFKFIPKEIGDDVIINSLIHYANLQPGENSIKVNEISIIQPKAEVAAVPIDQTGIGTPDLNAAINVPIKATKFNVKMEFLSSYAGIKGFFSDLAKLQRSYDFDNFKISRFSPNEVGTSASLLFETELTFNFLEEYKASLVDQNLLGNNFDTETINKIKQMNSEIINVVNDSTGKPSPFIP